MAIELPPLPYARDALAPLLSAETLDVHHGKHHRAYVTQVNEAIEGGEFASAPLETIVKQASGRLFDSAAQAWNHAFYWRCLDPRGGGEPTGKLADAIRKSFGGFAPFQEQFTKSCLSHFGSGWGWLVAQPDGRLVITTTPNAATPLTTGGRALLTCDVWEHAYYIDHRNDRAAYLAAFWKLVNWRFAAGQIG
jgi:Fe-Mn family superoxide dismutase